MAAPLEHRRQAIAAALRAAMAEPPPSAPNHVEPPSLVEPTGAASEPTNAIEPLVDTVTFDEPDGGDPPPLRSLREALTAEIEWDEPEHVEDLDELDRSPDDLSGLEEFDGDWVTPSVPPLEVSGSMSQVASLALFGHA